MKKQFPILFSLLSFLAIFSLSCSEENNQFKKFNKGTFVDDRDGQIYSWVKLKDGKIWMSQNLNFETPGSWCYNDDPENCNKYGRLYSYESAQKICPKRWHLPWVKDWEEMINCYGAVYEAPPDQNPQMLLYEQSQRAFDSLAQKDVFNPQYGGTRNRIGEYSSIRWAAKYWSQRDKKTDPAKSYGFSKNGRMISNTGDFNMETFAFSCRCIKNQ